MNDLLPLTVGHRAERVRSSMAGAGCEALLVTGLPNVRWLTGFSGSAGRVLVLPDRMLLVTDGRYGDQARAQLADAHTDADVIVGRNIPTQNQALADATSGIGTLGLEAAHVSWADLTIYQAALAPELVATNGLVEAHRLLKDPAEVARIEAAADIADTALATVIALLDGEPTEAEFALALDTEMRRLGASGPSFETIVASGPNAALPHHRPSDRRIVGGDTVVLDFGALVDGYHSDMTRTALVGAVAPELVDVFGIVEAAQAAGVRAFEPDLPARAADAVCRDAIAAAGYGEQFSHGTGHGVGLLIHESPWLNATSDDVLARDAVLTVEPGVYLFGLGGVRIEDTVVVTSDGCRPLTKTPKDLSCLRSPRTT